MFPWISGQFKVRAVNSQVIEPEGSLAREDQVRFFGLAATLLILLDSGTALASEEEHHKNAIAGFIGVTYERRENGLAIGIEYERKLTESVGIALLAERTWGDFDFWVVAAPVYFGTDRWRFGIGPGVEGSPSDTESLVRAIIAYEYEGEDLHYAPGIAIDFVGGEQVFVLGVAIGFGF